MDITAFERRLSSLVDLDADDRQAVAALHAVAHLLCELFTRAEQVSLVQHERLNIPLTQEEIGDALGLSAVHVNRTLQRLRADGLIVLENKELTIADSGGLRSAASFRHDYLRSWRDAAR